ncbi:DUF2163 domain-containing protein [Pseudaestuariivita atlantica]|uniref:Phage protein n=1 Tax=Pseudaestuariivita atlantica TaxID=1317121 RepID=A0A0L1JM13_9RHOB|nr:DUF2163 domain-containing protein [Pseudaestuariivita atlantica]KNG92767.1 phage protein [Pseudaestuariivita atlantica]
MNALIEHLKTGATHVCHAWALTRADGKVMGFTDHDRDLAFDGITFRADSGLSAMALQQSTGLSVDNTEAVGALSHDAIAEDEIDAGRFDRAEIRAWLVRWDDVAVRKLLFRGAIGEIVRGDGAFRAEIRGLTDVLNQPVGRVYQKPCSAVLGDASCRVDLSTPGYRHEGPVEAVEENRVLRFPELAAFEPEWFQRGVVRIVSGEAEGLTGMIKDDRIEGEARVIELWDSLRAPLAPGDVVQVTVGCDRRFQTCRFKFDNVLNFQGFPDIPEDDWVMVQPARARVNSGGSRR